MPLPDASKARVVLADPGTLTSQAVFAVTGSPVDLVFVDGGAVLVVASEAADGGAGALDLWKIKADKKHGLVRKKEWKVQLEGRPVKISVAPDQRHIAVGLAHGGLQILDVETKTVVQAADLPAAPRDVVWCEPSPPGPTLPDWSDDDPPVLNLGR